MLKMAILILMIIKIQLAMKAEGIRIFTLLLMAEKKKSKLTMSGLCLNEI